MTLLELLPERDMFLVRASTGLPRGSDEPTYALGTIYRDALGLVFDARVTLHFEGDVLDAEVVG